MEPKWVETPDGQIEVEDPDDYLIYLEDILKRIHELVPCSYSIVFYYATTSQTYAYYVDVYCTIYTFNETAKCRFHFILIELFL